MRKRGGFTLIELLVVIAIIATLASMIMVTLFKAKQKAKKAAAVTELKALDVALKQYYQEYASWPRFMPVVPITQPALETSGFPIEGMVARVLAGESENGNNPKRRRFISFSRRDAGGDPVNPWGGRYFVKVDTDYSGEITAGGGEPSDPPNSAVRRPVIVWTINPDVPQADNLHVIGSWKL